MTCAISSTRSGCGSLTSGGIHHGPTLTSSAGPVTAWARHDYNGGISPHGEASLVAFGKTTITIEIASSAVCQPKTA